MAIDIGSGGGSPAIALKLAVPALRMVLVESKARKCAFLREVVRELGLTEVDVENRRFEEMASRVDLRARVDLATIRAVKIDRSLLAAVQFFLTPGGRLFYFGTATEAPAADARPFASVVTRTLVPVWNTRLFVFEQSS